MNQRDPSTPSLLRRWNGGDCDALEELVARDLDWIHGRVRKRLGAKLRSRADSMDLVSESMIQFLRYGPRIEIESEAQYRALMCRIIENTIRGEAARHNASRRRMSREQPLPPETVVRIGSSRHGATNPADAAERSDDEAWVRLAVELLDVDAREIIVLRDWEGLDFGRIGERLRVSAEAARKRYGRALQVLARKLHELRSGDASAALS